MVYCTECGEKLTLRFKQDEGLVPYCDKCGAYRYPIFDTVVSMVVTNRTKDKILLAKNVGQDDFVLFAGYVKKGETAEKAVAREFKEETKLDAVKFKYTGSRFHEPKNLLMLNFVVMAENGEPVPDPSELASVQWFTYEEALKAIKKDSTAEQFLKSAAAELKKL